MSTCPSPSPMHRVGPSLLGGHGMFAIQPIKQGDLILSERALLIAPAEMRYTTEGVEKLKGTKRMRGVLRGAEKQLETLLRRMDRQDQTKYLSLANVHKKDGSGPLLGILRTNGYCIDGLREPGVDGNAGAYSGVFNELSRVNHICCPNSTRRFHMPSLSMRLYATRDIAEGEEITTNYTGTWESTVARQEKLSPYGFTCSCPCCSNCEASDRRRAHLQAQFNPRRLSMRLNKWAHTNTSGITNEEMLTEVEEGLRLYAEEGLESHNLYPTFLLHALDRAWYGFGQDVRNLPDAGGSSIPLTIPT
ncbi:hypothetical protein CPB85DRAFT_1431704 [Mucidula mucida]|nr:hypothetical protein CPB85DRAFT_1431704 [Mucidula mucida]